MPVLNKVNSDIVQSAGVSILTIQCKNPELSKVVVSSAEVDCRLRVAGTRRSLRTNHFLLLFRPNPLSSEVGSYFFLFSFRIFYSSGWYARCWKIWEEQTLRSRSWSTPQGFSCLHVEESESEKRVLRISDKNVKKNNIAVHFFLYSICLAIENFSPFQQMRCKFIFKCNISRKKKGSSAFTKCWNLSKRATKMVKSISGSGEKVIFNGIMEINQQWSRDLSWHFFFLCLSWNLNR